MVHFIKRKSVPHRFTAIADTCCSAGKSGMCINGLQTVLIFYLKLIMKENGIFTKDVEEVDDFKYSRYLKENLLSLTDCGEVESLGELLHDYVDNINRLINYSRYYLKMTEREIGEAAEIYGIVPVRDEYSVVRKCLIWGKNNTDVIDHTDMIWLPNVLNMTTKYRQYDYIFIDEAQDMTLARQGLVDKVFKRGARFFAVGDRKQQINVWCGATEESLDNYLRRPNTIELTLPVSFLPHLR